MPNKSRLQTFFLLDFREVRAVLIERFAARCTHAALRTFEFDAPLAARFTEEDAWITLDCDALRLGSF